MAEWWPIRVANKSRDQTDKIVEEAAWPSGLGRWI